MVDMIRKIVTCEVKEVADRVLEFVGSTEKQDRDGEVIIASGWNLKNYKKNPVFRWAHRYEQPPIGKANKVWIDNGNLKFQIEFAPKETYEFADTIYKLYQGGFLKATSVGFVPDPEAIIEGDGEKTPRRTYNKQELLELSGVPVPSNPDALVQARDDGLITIKEFEAITKPEETDDWIRIPVAECDVTATIDISKKEGIKALYCGKEKKVRTYMFDRREPYNWTMERAKKWVEDHKGKMDAILNSTENEPESLDFDFLLIEVSEPELPKRREYSQAEIMDELDYLIKLIEGEGMNEEVKEDAWNLVREIMRLTGDEIPDDILAKVGAVLSSKNKDNLKRAQSLIQSVLDSAGPETESVSFAKSTDEAIAEAREIAEAVAKEIQLQMDKMQGKVI